MSKYSDLQKRMKNLQKHEDVEYTIDFGPALPPWEPGMDREKWMERCDDFDARYTAWARRNGVIVIKFEANPEPKEE